MNFLFLGFFRDKHFYLRFFNTRTQSPYLCAYIGPLQRLLDKSYISNLCPLLSFFIFWGMVLIWLCSEVTPALHSETTPGWLRKPGCSGENQGQNMQGKCPLSPILLQSLYLSHFYYSYSCFSKKLGIIPTVPGIPAATMSCWDQTRPKCKAWSQLNEL